MIDKNVRDELKHLSVEEIKNLQPKIGASVGLINITNDLNLGMVIRTATLFGFDDIHVFGRRKIDRRPMVGCQNYIDVHRHYCMVNEENPDYIWILDYLKENGYFIVACDTHCAVPFKEGLDSITSDKKVIFLFGNEGLGLPKDFIDECDMSVYIKQNSVMRSLNVSIAAGIILNEWKELQI